MSYVQIQPLCLCWTGNEPLLTSGLLGPVRVMTMETDRGHEQ